MSEHVFNLNDEIICDHPVTAKTKRLWAVEMGCAAELRRICSKYNIKYFAGGGTLLGAVRHQGFIPWDDDMDFFMLKEDYDRLLGVIEGELRPPYVFSQSVGVSRIRNSNTTACTDVELKNALPPYNLGIFIDIFCLYALPDSRFLRKLHKFQIQTLKIARRGERRLDLQSKYGNTTLKDRLHPTIVAYKALRLLGVRDTKKAMLQSFAKYEGKGAHDVGLTSFLTYNERYIWRREIFEDAPVDLPFENTIVPCPSAFDEFLKVSFGDYMKFVKSDAQHSMPIMDPDKPASYYVDQIRATQLSGLSK